MIFRRLPTSCTSHQRVLSIEICEPRFCLDGATFSEPIVVDTLLGADSVHAADLDGDGDPDLLTASWEGTIAWYENTNGRADFGPRQVITTEAVGESNGLANTSLVSVADLDGDGDLDVFSTATALAWYENLDGAGTFGQPRRIGSEGFWLKTSLVDFDGDGDVDVLTGRSWFQNTNGLGDFGPEKRYPFELRWFLVAESGDFDGDGDVDVVMGEFAEIRWLENRDGRGNFGVVSPPAASGFNGIYTIATGDMDGDGDLDVLGASVFHHLVWLENSDGQGTFDVRHEIAYGGYISYLAVDLDNDNDLDVFSNNGWYENVDGQGQFVDGDLFRTNAVFAADLDGDGDVDLLSATARDGQIAWYENHLFTSAIPGDSNRDGFFDSSDLVLVFSRG